MRPGRGARAGAATTRSCRSWAAGPRRRSRPPARGPRGPPGAARAAHSPLPLPLPAATPATAAPAPAAPATPGTRTGANVDEVGPVDGTAVGMPGSAPSPQTPVWPGTSVTAPRAARPRRPASTGTALAAAVSGAPFRAAAAESPSGAFVVRSWNVDAAALALRVAGDSSERSGRSSAISRPATPRPTRITNAPGVVSAGSSRSARNRPMWPPPRSTSTWNAPSKPAYAIAIPSSVRPHGAPGSLPGPHSRYQPESSSTAGRSQRPVPK